MKNKSYIYSVIIWCMFLCLLGGCASKKDVSVSLEEDDATVDIDKTEESYPIIYDESHYSMKPEEIESENYIDSIIDSGQTEKYKPKLYASISEMIRENDSYYSEHYDVYEGISAKEEDYEKALAAYDRDIGEVTAQSIFEMSGGSLSRMRYSFGYIDDDFIPEVFLCCENTKVSGIQIFTYDIKEDKVVWVGEYGSTGTMEYVEGYNRIVVSSGGFGLFYSTYIEFRNSLIPHIIGKVAYCYHESGPAYYARLPFDETSDGSINSPRTRFYKGVEDNAEYKNDFSIYDDKYVVSGDEFSAITTVLSNYPSPGSRVYVEQSKMDIVDLNPGGIELDYLKDE
ncbi:MAG: hypothetical protein K6A74_09315 [Lachnospiraceae bacterium]|nr:hypothetical protein [Lachnospiraceae bacterium]